MADNLSILRDTLSSGGAQRAKRGMQTMREVKAHAAVMKSDDTDELKGAIIRLNKLTGGAETPPRANVPRGFYLNIRV